jgi:hypothetical protein
MKIQVKDSIVRGPADGKFLYAVVNIDEQDIEDSSIELWAANDEDHLKQLVKDDYVGDPDDGEIEKPKTENDENFDESYTFLADNFENEDWGYVIQFELIGEIKR